jgi:hypothetical protein
MMTDYTVDNIEEQLNDFIDNGILTRNGRTIEINYSDPNVYIKCEPTGKKNDVRAEIFKVTHNICEDRPIEEANPDLIVLSIHNLLKAHVGEK